jgi:hypothetical protein
MRARLTLTLALLLAPMATRADDPVITVDCLCVEDEQGAVRGRSDATTSEAGLDPLETGESFMLLRADTDQCSKYPSGCGDARFTPMTGERRARLDGASYMLMEGDFKLTIEGVAAPPPGDEPLLEVDCLCLWADTGSFAALSDDPPGRLGLPALVPRETVVRFKGHEQGCSKHATACAEPMTAADGEVRATINYYEYPAPDGGYKLRINGDLAQQ